MTESPGETVQIDDITVAYRVAGEGPPLVLVHGLAEDHESWARQQQELSDRRTFAYDLRGHMGTSLGGADGTLEQLGRDLIAFLEDVVGEPAAAVGFSLGGVVVLWAAAERPDLIPHAVVLGTSSVVGRAALPFYEQRIALARRGDARALAEALREDTAAAITSSAVDVEAVTARRARAVGGGAGYVNAATAMIRLHEEPLTPRLGRITSPVDVVGADHDAFCPRKAAEILLAGLVDGRYHEIPNAGHLMNVDNPAAVTATLRLALQA